MKPPSDIELRQQMTEDYARGAKRLGLEPNMRQIEDLVISDLEMVDRYEAAQASKPKPKGRKRKRGARTCELEAELQKNNLRAYVDEQPKERRGDIVADAIPRSEKAKAMFRRIKVILHPRGSIAAAAIKGKALGDIHEECNDPQLAREFLELWTWYVPLRALSSPKNPFFWLNEADAAKKFIRGLEDICDRSTGRHGPWWVR